jgi:hypothetical protein
VLIISEPNLFARVNFDHVMPPAAASQLYDKLLAIAKHTYAADKIFGVPFGAPKRT